MVETFNAVVPDELIDRLSVAKKEAQERGERGKDVVTVPFGGEAMQIASHGARGTLFILRHPDFSVDMRSPRTEWNITVRYSAAGIWQHGMDELRRRVHAMITSECYPKAENGVEWVQISSAHIAFDFYSPDFTAEMKPEIISRIVCHSSSKKHINFSVKGSAWGRADYLETVTIGNKKSVEVQVYDKGKEITEISGKEWMLKVWEQNGYYPPDDKKLKDVWRLEVRIGKEFLNDRNIKTYEDFNKNISEILTEALKTKRLTAQSDDSNIRRRPLHELWTMALQRAGLAVRMLPIGRQISMSGQALSEMLDKQAAGIIRAKTVLEVGDAEADDMMVMAHRTWQTAKDDKHHDMKTERSRERYKYVSVAR